MRLYFDYNATAPLRPEVKEALAPWLVGEPGLGNASSIHWAGRAERKALEAARASVAARFARKPSEIIFTSGGTEADNLALFGVALHPAHRGQQVVVSAAEHPAVLAAAERLEQSGVAVARVPVTAGRVDLTALERALQEKTALVSVMTANNETGVISPLAQVLALARARGAIVHTDAVQAVGRLPLPLEADLISVSAHKLGGPRGVGILVRREGVPLLPQLVGGPQERGYRAGTEAAWLAVAAARALGLAEDERSAAVPRWAALRDRLDACLLAIPACRVLGRDGPRVCNTTTALFDGVEGESLLQALDLAGVAASSGSACSSGSLEPSHVLLAMGISGPAALSAVRFSLGWATREDEVDALVALLPDLVGRVRAAAR